MRPWNKITINDCNEPLRSISSSIYCLKPHPYLSLGAPYGANVDPWHLRVDVIRRLNLAQDYLYRLDNKLKLAVFDAWRPIAVQRFMVDYVIQQQCKIKGIDPLDLTQNIYLKKVVDEVSNFWAPPSLNSSTPPPHSTGAAVDLTLIDKDESPLDMGGEIDAIGSFSSPDYYAKHSNLDSSLFSLYHSRRSLLRLVMESSGFVQHPNEWWHFSFGDQLWAWRCNSSEAIYGGISDVSNFNIDSSPNCLT